MLLPESQPFVWNEEEWRKHIESVVLTVGSYENDKRIVRKTNLDRLPWAVDHRDGTRWSSELYDNLNDAIYDFMNLETLPVLDGPEIPDPAKSDDFGLQSQMTSDEPNPAKSADFAEPRKQSQSTLFAAESRVNPGERREAAESEESMGYYAEYEVIQRQVYHVVPAENGWEVKKEGNKRASAKARLKADAVSEAKRLAKKAKLGQVIIHKKDGKIQTEYTYGEDPRETKG